MKLEEAAVHWTQTINGWYGINATIEEVLEAFNKNYLDKKTWDDESYVEVFFKSKDGGYSKWLDTVDREGLADCVEIARGKGPLPTYADLGGRLMNKVMR